MIRRKSLWIVGLFAAIVGCDEAVAPVRIATFSIEFYTDEPPLPPVTAEGGYRVARIGGGYQVPCDGVRPAHVEPTVTFDGSAILLVLTWPGDVDSCTPAEVNFVYEAMLQFLEAGTYQLQVVHVVGQDSFTALEQDLVVD